MDNSNNNSVNNQDIMQPVANNVSVNNQNTNDPTTNNYNQPVNKSKNVVVKVLAIIGGVVVGIVVLIIAIFSLVSAKSNKLICKSNEGNITIMYNDSTINGYTASNISYDLDGQKAIAKQIGIESYISQFQAWFEANTTGTCTVKEK